MTSGITLPKSGWHERAAMKALIAALDGANGTTRIVGGAVRDTLLGLPVKDVDLATRLMPKDVMARLKEAGIKAVPTGIDHGTVTAVTDSGPVEITTLRRDVSTDGRRATIAFSEDWKEDATRRDFTINALSVDPDTLEVFDYFGGLKDLEACDIRFIGSAAQRIAEDHLRIMRYFRFLARFGQNTIDEDTFAACAKAAASLQSLSRERIADELMKILGTDDPGFAVDQMFKAGIFPNIIAETDKLAPTLLHSLVAREQANGIAPSAVRRLVALLPKDARKAEKIVAGLRFSKKMRRSVVQRIGTLTPTANDIPALAYQHDVNTAQDIALLFAADDQLEASLVKLNGWEKPVFPIKGGALIKMGLEPGPIVAETLAQIEKAWISEGFPDETRVIQIARQSIR